MQTMNRLYFSLTNKCNMTCPFCCMYSSPEKNTFLKFSEFQSWVDRWDEDFELQLEGGEPFLHPFFYLFLEYAHSTDKCKKIIISTNGVLLMKHLQRLTDFLEFSKIP